MAGRATFFFRTRYSTQCLWPGYFDGVKIHVHCSPHLIMGIHCFYTARLTTDSFICGVETTFLRCGGAQRDSTLAYRGAPRYPPPVYKSSSRTPEQPVSYHSPSMLLRVMGTSCVATRHCELGVQFPKHLSMRNP